MPIPAMLRAVLTITDLLVTSVLGQEHHLLLIGLN